jgi:hypothetical protein
MCSVIAEKHKPNRNTDALYLRTCVRTHCASFCSICPLRRGIIRIGRNQRYRKRRLLLEDERTARPGNAAAHEGHAKTLKTTPKTPHQIGSLGPNPAGPRAGCVSGESQQMRRDRVTNM